MTLSDFLNFLTKKSLFITSTRIRNQYYLDVLSWNIFVDAFFIIFFKEELILKTILFLNHFSHVCAIVGGYETEPHRNVLFNMIEYEFKLIISMFQKYHPRAPYMVSVNKGYHTCGGALINENWVLSSGMCSASKVLIRLGEHNLRRNEGTEQWLEYRSNRLFLKATIACY